MSDSEVGPPAGLAAVANPGYTLVMRRLGPGAKLTANLHLTPGLWTTPFTHAFLECEAGHHTDCHAWECDVGPSYGWGAWGWRLYNVEVLSVRGVLVAYNRKFARTYLFLGEYVRIEK